MHIFYYLLNTKSTNKFWKAGLKNLNYFRKLLFWLKTKEVQAENDQPMSAQGLTGKLKTDLKTIQVLLNNSSDLVIREFNFGEQKIKQAGLAFIEGMVDIESINTNLIKPLIYDSHLFKDRDLPSNDLAFIQHSLLAIGNVTEENSLETLTSSVLRGNVIFLLEGNTSFLAIAAQGWEKRSIEEPKIEQVVRGPREGFTETLSTNTAMLRRKIWNPDLVFEQMIIGKRTRTRVVIAYVKNVAPNDLIDEVKHRLNRIQIEDVLESGYIEQLIEDAPFSPFSTVGNSEKPDRVAGRILEGRVAIFVDGTPFVLTVPYLFIEGLQASEDYYSRPYFASFVRTIRYIAFITTLLAPALYVALESFHPELMPTPLVITMAAAVAGTPFPSVVEAFLMSLVFELLREGGIRLPTTIGPALSIVGALIIGDAAVNAGLISAPMVIVIAITAVSSFLVVPHTDAVTLLRFALIIVAGILGIYGIGISLIAIAFHLCSLRSFGVDYLAPLAPLSLTGLKDAIIRVPLKGLTNRKPLIKYLEADDQSFRSTPDQTQNKQKP